jgi:hypothetical protein
MTTEAFVKELCIKAEMEQEGIFARGREEGWLEAEDEVFKDRSITRKNVARICHTYLLKVMNVRDLDINGANKIRDLYDCRVCANHIAQVYLRGIMDAKNIMRDGEFLWFDLDGEDDDAYNSAVIDRLLLVHVGDHVHQDMSGS